jgi:hypothetical protein
MNRADGSNNTSPKSRNGKMPTGPKGEKRPADVMGNAVKEQIVDDEPKAGKRGPYKKKQKIV